MRNSFFALVASLVFTCGSLWAAQECGAVVAASARDIPIAYRVDVLVVGGTSGGVTAAIAAARAGEKVLLLTDRNYLGDDLCGAYRLWLEEGEQASLPLTAEVFRDSSADQGVPFSYTADRPAADKHPDSKPPAKLASCPTVSVASDCVEFGGDVTLTLDLGKPMELQSVTANLFQDDRSHKVHDLTVQGSQDGKRWSKLAYVLNEEKPDANHAVALTVALKGQARYLQLQYRKSDDASRMLLSRIIVQAVDPKNPNQRRSPTPMHVKRTLEQAMLQAGAEFLFACYPSEVLFDKAGNPAGVVMANRAGRQAILARTIIDATPRAAVARLAGAEFAPYPAGRQSFTRVVLGGEPMSGPAVKSVRPLPVAIPTRQVGDLPAYEYTLELEMKDGSWPAFARAEELARDATWTPGLIDASESLFQVPPDPVKSRRAAGGQWAGAATAELDAFRPAGVERLYVLGGCAELTRDAAARLVRPAALMEMGDRVGQAAAKEAAAAPAVVAADIGPRAKSGTAAAGGAPAVAGGTSKVAGDLKELLGGVRPTQSGLPVLHLPTSALPVLGEYDVVVVGGGTGGAPAGISAARAGAKTLVVEYLHGQGGVSTLGLIGIYYAGNVVGFTTEIDEGLKAMAQGSPFVRDKQGRAWNTEWRMEWYRRELRKAGGEFWPHSIGCGAIVDAGHVRGVVVATPAGWGVVLAKNVIDATGSSDIAIAAGAKYVFTDATTAAMQGTGLPYRNIYDLNGRSRFYTNTDYTYADESDLLDVWRLFLRARQKFAMHYDLSQLVDARERRRIVGEYTLTPMDVFDNRTYDDAICYAKSNFDSHGFAVHPLFLLKSTLAAPRASYCAYIPYRALLPKGLENVLVIGLGVSAHRDAMPILRMEADVQNTGYAAGLAAATAARSGSGLRQIDVKALQRQLVAKGNLPKEALTCGDNFAVSRQRLEQAVAAVQKEYNDLPMVLAHWDETHAMVKQAYAKATDPSAKLALAHILGMMGDPAGADVLLAKVRSIPDEGWAPCGPRFGGYLNEADTYMIALGRTRDPRATEAIVAKLRQLGTRNEFAHYRAVAMALEAVGDPAAAQPLAELLGQEGMTGYNVSMELMLQAEPDYPREREPALRELILARALYRCGDYNGVGERILRNYAADLRGHYSRHAQAVLNEKRTAETPATQPASEK